jgi:ubiquinone/menaquinone biosynthesis C-methylase UbiE
VKFGTHIQDWEEMAQDPLWAILTSRRAWKLEDFFATGGTDVRNLFSALARLGITPSNHRAMDFGCGVGRVTRHLSKRFDECWGIDVSARMLELAAEYNPECHFHLNRGNDLKEFPDNHFDLVYSVLVLQHQPNAEVAQAYIREFIRVLQPGGALVFQMPTSIPWRYSFGPRRLIYKMLRTIGMNPALLHRWRLMPMKMIALSPERVTLAIENAGGKLIASEVDHRTEPIPDATYYCIK